MWSRSKWIPFLTNVEFPDSWEGITHRLILLLLYNTGMRRAELTGLKETQVDAGNCSLKVLGKGNKERIIPVNSSLLRELEQYMAAKHTRFEKTDKGLLLVSSKGKPAVRQVCVPGGTALPQPYYHYR